MTTIDELVSHIETEITSHQTREATARAEAESILSAAQAGGKEYLSQPQDARMEALFKDIEHAKAAQKRGAAKLSRAKAVATEEAENDRVAWDRSTWRETAAGKRMPKYDEVAHIGSEPQTYRSPAEHGTALDREEEPSFLRDLYSAQVLSDPAAMGRLEHHGRQVLAEQPLVAKQLRSFGTGAVPGFAPPIYLAEEFALFARAGRPAANLCRSVPLEADGMTVNIPRLTTSTATGIQAAEGNAVTTQDLPKTLRARS